MRNQWIKDRLLELRGSGAKKSQAGLAEAIGISPDKISKTIKGDRQPQPDEMIPIAVYLEMPVEMVLAKFSQQEPPPSFPPEAAASGLIALLEGRLKFALADDVRSELETDFREFLSRQRRGNAKT